MRIISDLKKYYSKLIYVIPVLCSSLFFIGISQHSLWYDELQTWATVSKESFSQFISYAVVKQAGPLLYYFVLWIFNPLVVWNEFSLRIFSALFLTGSLICFFNIIKKYANTATAITFCLLLISNKEIVYYSQEARPYAAMIFMISLSLKLYFEYVENQTNFKKQKWLVLANYGIMYCHYYGIFFVFAESILLFIFTENSFIKRIKFTLINISGVAPVLIFFAIKDVNATLPFLEKLSLKNLNLSFLSFSNSRLEIISITTLIISILYKLFSGEIKKGMKIILLHTIYLLFLIYLSVFIGSQLKPIYISRYLIFTWPLFLLIISLGINIFCSEIMRPIKSKWLVRLTHFSVIVTSVLFFKYVSTGVSHNIKYPTREAYKAIEQDNISNTKKNFIILDDASGDSFMYYASHNPKNILLEMQCLFFPTSDKLDWLNLYLNSEISKTYYFLKVSYGNNEPISDYMQNLDFRKKIIFYSGDVSVIKFIAR